MAKEELLAINSVLTNKDIASLYGPYVDELFVAYKDVWKSIKQYNAKHHAIPDVSVITEAYPDFEEVQVKGASDYYLDNLKNYYIKNRLENIALGIASQIDDLSSNELVSKLQRAVSDLGKFSSSAKNKNIMDVEDAERHYEAVREKAEAMGGTPGIPTGISFIDSAYPSGLAGGDLVVVLGWTGRAKSLFTTLVCVNAHKCGFIPMMTSLEMSFEKVRDRVFTIQGSGLFSNSDLSLGNISPDDFRSFKATLEDKQDFLVLTNAGTDEMTPNSIQVQIDQHKPNLLVFDYAQLGSDNENSTDMTARMRNMSKQFKALAVRNDIPVILISSATPDSSASSDEPPTIEQVAWSKQLAFDADLAFAVHKHDDSDVIEIVCRKNRNGPLFAGFLRWDIDRGIIEEVFDL